MDLAKTCGVDIDILEEKIMELLNTDIDLPISYKNRLLELIFSKGKRLRPIFTVLGSYFGNKKVDNIYTIAAVFELIHTASLVHDDIIDNADVRRGTPTLHIQYDTYKALILGDYLVALNCGVISSLKIEHIYHENFSLTDLCDAEIIQQNLLYNFDIKFNEYINNIGNKTALLIVASIICGAKLADANQKTLGILAEYAFNAGIAFQIMDDILDFTQEKIHLGKPNGHDLISGIITLPVILALKKKNYRKKIACLSAKSPKDDFLECIKLIQKSRAIKKSKKVMKKYIEKAKNTLRKLKHPKKGLLKQILVVLEQRTQ